MTFARRVFTAAGVYGIAALLPLYFLEDRFGQDLPPPVNHPELYYGFVGIALAWQVVFLILGRDPARHRIMMIPATLEKGTFGIATLVLWSGGRVAGMAIGTALIDLVWGVLFAVAWRRTAPGSGGGVG